MKFTIVRLPRFTKKSGIIFGHWKSFKNVKICSFFILKALFVLKIFKICLDSLFMENKDLIRKISSISRFMTSKRGKQTIAIHMLINISRSKNNQAIKFGQLIEYNMRNIFFEISCTKCGGETIPRSFSNKSKLSISLDH